MLAALDILLVWSCCGGEYPDDAGKRVAYRRADVSVRPDMPRKRGGYTIGS